MKAARLRTPRNWEFLELDRPQPEAGKMLVRLEQVAICGSDLPDFRGVAPEYPLPYGGTGHEGVGVVEACPGGTYRQGERVLLWGFDREHGLFQEYVLTRDQGLLRMPAEQPVEVVLMSQLLGTVLRCFRKLGNVLGQRAVVLGQGPTGQLFNAVLRNLGARQIIGVDLVDYRLEVGKRMGATHVLNAAREDVVEGVRELTGGQMAELVVEAVGGEQTYGQCLDLARRFAQIICFGVPDKENHEGIIKLPLLGMQRRELKLVLSVNYGDNPYEDYSLALDWIVQGRIDVRPIITHILPFADIQRGFELAVDRPAEEKPIKVILQF